MNAPSPSSHDIFVSYSRQDAEWAGAFVGTLKRRGWSVFLDSRSIRAGDEWSPEIDAAIDAAKAVIALWSGRSVNSSYVIYEAARAVVRGTLVPLSIDRTRAPPAFRRFQAQPMHVAGATNMPPDLVATIEMRLAAPPTPPSPEEQRLREELARTAALARDRGVPLLALQRLLERLGEVDVAPEAVSSRLESFVSEFLKLKADLARPTNANPDVTTTQSRALDLLSAGDLDGARALIDDALTRRRELYQQSARETATLLADRSRIDVLQVCYPEAIVALEEAASVVHFDDEAVLAYLEALADVLIRQGEEFGDNAALTRAMDVIRRRALPLVPREAYPSSWARLQSLLANALELLGARDGRTDLLQQAIVVYRVALEEGNRSRSPLDWAETQNHLGNALFRLGEREGGTARIAEAVVAYRAALEERTRERVPLAWAMTQLNLGSALAMYGRREGGTADLEEAVVAFRSVLEEFTRDRVPLDWAATQNNLGNALRMLGERRNEAAPLEEAVKAYRGALEEYTRDRVPLDWAGTQNNLGDALALLGARERSTDYLHQAVAAYQASLEGRTRDRAPMDWATTQHNLGCALLSVGVLEGDTNRLESAAVAFRAALQVRTSDRVPRLWEKTRSLLGQTLSLLAERSSK